MNEELTSSVYRRLKLLSDLLELSAKHLDSAAAEAVEVFPSSPQKALAAKQFFNSREHLRLSLKSLKQGLDNL